MHNKKNSYYSAKEKVQFVMEGLKSPDGVAPYCRRKGISEVSFYKWKKQLVENADYLFEKRSRSSEKKITRLENEIQRKDKIIALVTEEALELKKKLTD